MPALDEARADLGCDEVLAFEDADCVASEPHEDRGDEMVLGERVEERLQPDGVVFPLVRKAEGRPDGDLEAVELDPGPPAGVARATRLAGQRRRRFRTFSRPTKRLIRRE